MSLILENQASGTCLLAFAWDGEFRDDRVEDIRVALAGWGRTLRAAFERTGKAPDATPARVFLRRSGITPSRYVPSSEALVKRLLAGESPGSPFPAVDVNNLVSATLGTPIGIYDAATLRPPFVYRKGKPGETMETLGKGTFDLDGRGALFDTEGPFGSPVSDGTRSRIVMQTRSWLWVAYGLPGEFTTLDEMLKQSIESYWTLTGDLSRALAQRAA